MTNKNISGYCQIPSGEQNCSQLGTTASRVIQVSWVTELGRIGESKASSSINKSLRLAVHGLTGCPHHSCGCKWLCPQLRGYKGSYKPMFRVLWDFLLLPIANCQKRDTVAYSLCTRRIWLSGFCLLFSTRASQPLDGLLHHHPPHPPPPAGRKGFKTQHILGVLYFQYLKMCVCAQMHTYVHLPWFSALEIINTNADWSKLHAKQRRMQKISSLSFLLHHYHSL